MDKKTEKEIKKRNNIKQGLYKDLKMEICPFNTGVECYHIGECMGCGWHPLVANERKRIIRGIVNCS